MLGLLRDSVCHMGFGLLTIQGESSLPSVNPTHTVSLPTTTDSTPSERSLNPRGFPRHRWNTTGHKLESGFSLMSLDLLLLSVRGILGLPFGLSILGPTCTLPLHTFFPTKTKSGTQSVRERGWSVKSIRLLPDD